MTITLPPELAAKVRLQVDSGSYDNEEQVLSEALAALEVVRAQMQMRKAELARRIDEADRGLAEPIDVNAFLERMKGPTPTVAVHEE
jgi:Arc/MetJ-type ribon-helix-helix transcriptional regulator